jgi:tetratricopeptide (TPR) repeat protein
MSPEKTNKTLSAEELHQRGWRLREKDQHLEALGYLDRAVVGYQKEGNYRGLIDALKDRCLTWKHLFLLDGDLVYAILSKKDAEAMLVIAQEKGLKDKFHTSYFRLGETATLFTDYPSAVEYFSKALKTYQGPLSEEGDYRCHLGEALYLNGQKEKGKTAILQGIREIEQGASETDSFLINVWRSGALMRLAEVLSKDESEQARTYFNEAKKIIDSDERLVIRKRQLEKLAQTINSSLK